MIEFNNSLNRLLETVLPGTLEDEFKQSLLALLAQEDKTYRYSSSLSNISLINLFLDQQRKNTVDYIISSNSVERAKAVMLPNVQSYIEKIYDLRKQYWLKVPIIDRLFLGIHDV